VTSILCYTCKYDKHMLFESTIDMTECHVTVATAVTCNELDQLWSVLSDTT